MSRSFDLNDYVTVDERITQFWARYPAPEGSIQTELLWVADDGRSVAIRATLYADGVLLATGIAQEEQGQGGTANRNNWWENCETSAIGRACANLDMSLSRNRPSREEMAKALREPAPAPEPPGPAEAAPPSLEEVVADSFATVAVRKSALHKLYSTAESPAELNALVNRVAKSGLDSEILRAAYRHHHARLSEGLVPA